MLEVTEDAVQQPLALLRIHKEHDLVLAFDNVALCTKFRSILKNFLEIQGKDLVVSPTSHEHIYTTAETKEKRQSRLERFFKIAYARVNSIKHKFEINQKNNNYSFVINLLRVHICLMVL